MATFICLMNWTEQGIKTAKNTDRRTQATRMLCEKLGGRFVSVYATAGQYDVVLTVDLPNEEAMAKLALAISQAGGARTTSMRAFSEEEFGRIAAEVPAF